MQPAKKDACAEGCKQMKDLQNKAPYINGWLVYMGTPDRMVLLQRDFDIPSEDDWVLLDSVLRSNDYEKLFDRFTETKFQPMTTVKKPINIQNCFPTWKWVVFIFMLVAILWMRYVTLLSIAITDNNVSSNNAGEKVVKVDDFNDQKTLLDNNFIVCNESYFYPTPAVPPPKYHEAIEAMLLVDDDCVGNRSSIRAERA